MNENGVRRKVCPCCGQPTITVSHFFQFSLDYRVGSRGKLLKTPHRSWDNDMEVETANCANPDCDAYWNSNDFIIDDNDMFVDYKYGVDNE